MSSSSSTRELASGKLLLDEPAEHVTRLKISNPDKRGALDHGHAQRGGRHEPEHGRAVPSVPVAAAPAELERVRRLYDAVAPRYVPEKDYAPVVLAKAVDEFALAMRAKARKASIPVVEQRPLARALYADAKVGRTIPVELYRAVAEVVAYVMHLKARDAGRLPPRGDA